MDVLFKSSKMKDGASADFAFREKARQEPIGTLSHIDTLMTYLQDSCNKSISDFDGITHDRARDFLPRFLTSSNMAISMVARPFIQYNIYGATERFYDLLEDVNGGRVHSGQAMAFTLASGQLIPGTIDSFTDESVSFNPRAQADANWCDSQHRTSEEPADSDADAADVEESPDDDEYEDFLSDEEFEDTPTE